MLEGRVSPKEIIILGVVVLLLAGGGIWRAVQVSSPGTEIIQAGSYGGSEAEAKSENTEPEMLTVHLVGAVKNPGIYMLPAGSRVYELLEQGGGFSSEADRETLNQARPLMDGEQIYIHRLGETPGPGESSGGGGKININRATASELTALPGIGEVRANQIVAHREEHGHFTDPAQIMDVSGIGDSTFNNIADKITIY